MEIIINPIFVFSSNRIIELISYVAFGIGFFGLLISLSMLIIYKNIISKAFKTTNIIERILKHPLPNRLNRMNFIVENSSNENLKLDIEIWKVKYYEIYKIQLPELIENVSQYFGVNKWSFKSKRFPSIKNLHRANKLLEISKNLELNVRDIYYETQKVTEVEFLLRDTKIIIQETANEIFDFVDLKKEQNELKVNVLIIEEYKQVINKKITICDYYIKIGKFEEAFKKIINLSEGISRFIKFIDKTHRIAMSLEKNGALYQKLEEINKQLILKNDKDHKLEDINNNFKEHKEKILQFIYSGKIDSATNQYQQLFNDIDRLSSYLKFEDKVFIFFENNIGKIQNIIKEFENESKKIEQLILLNTSLKNDIDIAKEKYYAIKPFIDSINDEYKIICSKFIKFKYSIEAYSVLYKCAYQIKNILTRLESYYNDFIEIYSILRTKDSFLEEVESKLDNIRTTLLCTESIIYRHSDIKNLQQYKNKIKARYQDLEDIEKKNNAILSSPDNFDAMLKKLDVQLRKTIYIKHNVIDEVMLDKLAQYVVTYANRYLDYKNNSNKKINEIMNAYELKDYKRTIELGIDLFEENKI
ncbi:Hypothetical protein, predicted transmembrane protein [Mycoplasma yeatsii 13926]|uniref:Septation ring formation regulator n=1 Tax=Mycoplasma yeatsii 13926 TaxID=1188240 RepID=S6G6S8_9MOLU|nr:hypothetical protein [Mycoplasma yeatsii]EOA07048.1 Hypothetical protein, predicted transmembrane protein [Mycoplasma yeatsii 13926]